MMRNKNEEDIENVYFEQIKLSNKRKKVLPEEVSITEYENRVKFIPPVFCVTPSHRTDGHFEYIKFVDVSNNVIVHACSKSLDSSNNVIICAFCGRNHDGDLVDIINKISHPAQLFFEGFKDSFKLDFKNRDEYITFYQKLVNYFDKIYDQEDLKRRKDIKDWLIRSLNVSE